MINPSHIVTDNETTWVATHGGGIYRYDSDNNTYQHFTRVNHGIASNVIYDMVLDSQKNLWLATVDGLSVYKMIHGTLFSSMSKKLKTMVPFGFGLNLMVWLNFSNKLILGTFI